MKMAKTTLVQTNLFQIQATAPESKSITDGKGWEGFGLDC